MIKQFEIQGPILIETRKFTDERGYFFESFNSERFNEAIGQEITFVQDNISKSKKGVIRGLHLQRPPHAQGKLVRVINGSVIDVAVDIRKDSPTYGKHISVLLSSENNHQFWIPEGFAHGFSVLEDDTIFAYKCTDFYHPESEMSIRFDDPTLNINWEVDPLFINQKDLDATFFANFATPF